MQQGLRWDRLWGYVIGLLSATFLVWFFASEASGLEPLLNLLGSAVRYVPQSIANVVSYFGDVSSGPLLASLVIGGAVGLVTTAFVATSQLPTVSRPSLHPIGVSFGLAAGVFALVVGVIFFYAMLLSLIGMIVVSLVIHRDLRRFFHRDTLRAIQSSGAARRIGVAALLGALLGAMGAQLIAIPTRHCTFEPTTSGFVVQVGIVLTVVSALVLLMPFWSLLAGRLRASRASRAGYFSGWLLPLGFLLPTLLVLLVFLYYPSLQVAEQSLFRIPRRRGAAPQFECLNNYVELANDSIYQNSFLTTFAITAAIVTISMVLALLIALLASQKIRGASIYRTLLIWPYALSPVVASVILITLFRSDRSGLFNYVLIEVFNAEPVRWLSNPDVVPWVVIAAAVYNILGFNIIFYIAGLQNIPKDLIEAAKIDGANSLQRLYRIVVPLLSPYSFFLLVANITYSFYGIYGVLDAFFPTDLPPTADGGKAANVLIYNLYKESFGTTSQLGEAAAQTVILFLLVAGITLLQFRFVESRVTYSS